MTTASWSPGAGLAAIALVSTAPSTGRITLPADVWADALIDTLVKAECMGLDSGGNVAPGREGMLVPRSPLGSMRDEAIKRYKASDRSDSAIVYLGCLGAVRIAHERSQRGMAAKAAASQLAGLELAGYVALTALGIAAVVATAWYAIERTKATVHVEGQTARAVAGANAAATIGAAAVAAGQPIPPEVVAALASLAKYEADTGGGFAYFLAGAGAALALVGAVVVYVKTRDEAA